MQVDISNPTLFAKEVVDAILDNLSDRSGIGDEIDCCDDEIKEEIQDTLEIIVFDILEKYG